MPLLQNMLLTSASPGAEFRGLHRLLFASVEHRDAVLIPMAAENGNWLRYVPRAKLERQLDVERIVAVATYKQPAIQLLTDAEITLRYPPRAGQKISAPIRIRDARLAAISPLVRGEDARPRSVSELLAKGFISRWITERQLEHLRSQLYHHMRIYFRGGSTDNSLLPDLTACGVIAPGETRIYTVKPGRPNALVLAGETDKAGYIIDAAEDMQIQAFWAGKLRSEGSADDWCDEYLSIYHHKSIHVVNGEEKVELKEPHERPTPRQLKTRGPKSDKRQCAFFKAISDLEYDQQYAPRFGSSRDGIVAVGQYGSMDLTGAKVQLVSIDDPRQRVGVASRMPVLELLTGMTLSVHGYYGQHSVEEALMALYMAGTSIDWLGKKLGLAWLTDELFPRLIPATILVDHDEPFTLEFKAAAAAAGISVEFPESLHAEDKADIESDHHRSHNATAHKIDGSTKGRPKKRGDPDPRDRACWNIQELLRAEWRYRNFLNNIQQVPHLVTTEMRRDKVHLNPTRANVMRWRRENTAVGFKAADPDKLITFCLPRLKVKICQDGVHLLRPDRGRGEEFVQGIRWVSPYLIDAGFVGGLRKSGVPLMAPCNKYDLSHIWIVDPDHGVQRLDAVCSDPLLTKELSLQELMNRRDEDRVIALRNRSVVDNERASVVMNRLAQNASARSGQEAASTESSAKVAKKDLRHGIKTAQQVEQEKLKARLRPDALTPIVGTPNHSQEFEFAPSAGTVTNPFADRMRRVIEGTTEKEGGP